MKRFLRSTGVLLLTCCLLGGCAARESYAPEEAPEMLMVQDFTPFYLIGPQQMTGPDATLRVDQRVRLLRKEFGYSYVKLEDGRIGYIPNGTFIDAPPRTQVFERVGDAAGGRNSARSFSEEPEASAPVEFEEMPLPDINTEVQDVPPPVFIDDLDPERKPEFRL